MLRFTVSGLLLIMCIFLIGGNTALVHRRKERPTNLASAGQREIIELEGVKYFFGVNAIVNFFEARIECENINMTLVNLQNQQKLDMFIDFLNENPGYDYWMWTSGHRTAGESSWTWSAINEPFTYASWAPQQPDVEIDIEACVNFAGTSVAPDGWEDDDCELWQMSFLCETNDMQ